MSLPGDWLYEKLARALDAATVESLVAPTIADLQHEVSLAGRSAWRAALARVRGYGAILRLLVACGIIWRFPMRRLITVLALGCVGSALLLVIVSVAYGPAEFGAFFLMAVLAPIALRFLAGGSSYRQMFVNCLGIGLMMGAVHFLWALLAGTPSRLPWYGYLLTVVFAAGCITLGSALAASVGWKPTAGDSPAYRRRMLQIVAASATFVVLYSVVYLSWRPGGIFHVLETLSFAAFLGFFFAAVSVAVYVPVFLGVRRVVRTPSARPLLAVLGAAMFPLPLLSFPVLQGRAVPAVLFLLGHSQVVLLMSLPYVLSGALLGWFLAGPSRPVEGPAAQDRVLALDRSGGRPHTLGPES